MRFVLLLSFLTLLLPAAELRQSPVLVSIGIDAQNPGLFWGHSSSQIAGVLYRSSDHGVTWHGVRYNGNPAANPPILAVEVHPTVSGRVYVQTGNTNGYLWMTSDSGVTWTNPGATFPPGLTPNGLFVAGNNVYLMLGAQLFRSADLGTTFDAPIATPCDASTTTGTGLLGSPPAPDRLACLGQDRRFRYSANRGTTWTIGAAIAANTLNSPSVYAHPTNPLEYYVNPLIGGGGGYQFLRSTDGLQTLTTTTPAPSGQVASMILSPDGGLTLHYDYARTGRVFRSRDFGRTWELASTDLGGDDNFFPIGGDEVLAVDRFTFILRRSTNAANSFTGVDVRQVPLLPTLPTIDITVEAGAGYDPLPEVPDIVVPGRTFPWSAFDATPDANAPWLRNLPPLYATTSGLAAGDYEGSATISTSGFNAGKLNVKLKVIPALAPQISFLSTRIAGNGTRITEQPAVAGPFQGQNGPAINSALSVLVGRAAGDPQGNVYIADARRVRKVAPDGTITNFAGTGENGQFGDGGLAINAAFQSVGNMLWTPEGLLIIDYTSRRVRRVLPNGTIESFYASVGNQFPIPMFSTATLAQDSQGLIYMASYDSVYRRNNNGVWTSVFSHFSVSPSITTTDLRGFAIDPTNDSFILAYDDRVYRRTAAGVVTLLLGTDGKYGFTGDNSGGAQGSQTDRPTAVATDTRGNIFVADHNRIRIIRPNGTIGTVAGNGSFGPTPGNGGAAISGGYGKILHVARLKDNELVLFSDLGYIFTLKEGAAPTSFIYPGGIVTITGRPKIAQGSIFSVYGEGMAGTSGSGPAPPLATEIGGTALEVNGARVPLFYVSPFLINAQLSYSTPLGLAQVRVIRNGVATGVETVEIVANAPDIIEYGDKWGVAVNADGVVNSQNAPAKAGTFVTLYLTGAGQVSPPLVEGLAAPIAPLSSPAVPYKLKLTKDGVTTEVPIAFLGHTPTTAGLIQANFQLPNLPAGVYTLVLTIGGADSNPVKFAIAL